MAHVFGGNYTEENLDKISFPMGGIGSGMICLDGNASFSHVSLRHKPEVFNKPLVFAAVNMQYGEKQTHRVLQGPVRDWQVHYPSSIIKEDGDSGNGSRNTTIGLPYFRNCSFNSKFPFGEISLSDDDLPLEVDICGWSPFIPGNSEDSSLPVAAVEYILTNTGKDTINGVFYFAARNFMKQQSKLSCDCGKVDQTDNNSVKPTKNGIIFNQEGSSDFPHDEGHFGIYCDDTEAINCCWFRGAWFDTQSVLWSEIAQGIMSAPPPAKDGDTQSDGGSISMSYHLKPGERKKIRILLSWYVPYSNLNCGLPEERKDERYRPWYAERFKSIEDVMHYWTQGYASMRKQTEDFTRALYKAAMPPEVTEAVAANLTILKSPTILRQTDGRLWAWEGCCDCSGCCYGSCTHVWNYAQALAHLFPDLERSMRHSEFYDAQDERGQQNFRISLPIGRSVPLKDAAADGQLGGIMKVYREWKISGDTGWLRNIWPQVRASLDYCIETWDPQKRGYLHEPHHNTYDIEFYGPDGMCNSFYLGALRAAVLMCDVLNESGDKYQKLYEAGRKFMEEELYNGEYFIQKIDTEGFKKAFMRDKENISPELLKLIKKEGSRYQYGDGCLSDGIIGAWMALVCGIGEILDETKVKSHLQAVYKYNFKRSLHDHTNPQRPSYAVREEAGLLLCTWPNKNRLTLPFPYSDEIWTGIEYQVAAHLIMLGEEDMGLDIIKAARGRYDGKVRNPFNEYECGHWYARAMSSYSLLQGYNVQLHR